MSHNIFSGFNANKTVRIWLHVQIKIQLSFTHRARQNIFELKTHNCEKKIEECNNTSCDLQVLTLRTSLRKNTIFALRKKYFNFFSHSSYLTLASKNISEFQNNFQKFWRTQNYFLLLLIFLNFFQDSLSLLKYFFKAKKVNQTSKKWSYFFFQALCVCVNFKNIKKIPPSKKKTHLCKKN